MGQGDDILQLAAHAQVSRMRDGSLRAADLMQATLARIEAVNGDVTAIVSLRNADDLMSEARAADAAPNKGALHGLPVAVKDLSDVAGLPTTRGSPAFAGQIATQDAAHVARMRAAGAIIIGKTNTPEFGLGSHTFNPVHGATCNPYDRAVSAGGSSGGAAVALACRMLSLADGSDMMGSLRNPAGWNNVYGFRPSWGRVQDNPRGDTVLHTLSTAGPMARCPADLSLLLEVMAGPHPGRPFGLAPTSFTAAPADISGKRIGWLADWGGAWAMEPGIQELCLKALGVFEAAGCHVAPVAAPFARDALWQSWTALRSWSVGTELNALMENPATRAQLKDTAIWEIAQSQALSPHQIHAASVIRSDWYTHAASLFETYDALVAPTAQVWPFAMGKAYPTCIAGRNMDTYHRWMEVMIPASLIGLPALAVPAGFGPQGLPMGMQLIGRHGDDQGLLTLAEAYHQATHWPQQCPPPM